MLPIEVSLAESETYRLEYRRMHYRQGGGTIFELISLSGGPPVWEQEFPTRVGWLRGWADGVTIPAGGAAAEVFCRLEQRGLAQRVRVTRGVAA